MNKMVVNRLAKCPAITEDNAGFPGLLVGVSGAYFGSINIVREDGAKLAGPRVIACAPVLG